MSRLTSGEILSKLISFNTVSSESNMELIEYVRDYLAEYGIEAQIIHDKVEKKANLLAVIGPKDVAGIMLSGHTDVVPVIGQDWQTDPFEMIGMDDKYYGRGTCDMKGFIACVLAKVPDFAAAELKEPIHLAFSYDEETGCTGVHSLVDVVNEMAVKPRACIVGEPTEMKVVNSHKGIRHLLTKVYGLENHSSTDRGVNAVSYAAEIVVFLDKLQEEMRGREPEIEGFDPPYATIHVGRMTGGHVQNITPNYCEIEWDYRPIPGTDEDEIFNRYQEYIDTVILPKICEKSDEYGDVKTDYLAKVPCLFPETGSDAETLVKHLAEQNSTHVVSYGTEAGIFHQKGGVPAVVCGPGSILQAHKANEFVAISELEACDKFLDRLFEIIKK
ncbi:acetylornithine deacetylase [Pseudemcibacter aquimaris]|uniref:acetylornithine deacetylase n=1 Tax=Pseudemcibacter aquimaris TaxID=2857064 RepID=UPI002010F405|nr:acetylornithine deacetylase [Pseudemcibacter aquimaris]MCC3862402.1 acetylornithine deacetylase [Pseudemcibacter aquimaris]WDU59168.1 acetylornithine deacetylase [Pseudemcibacter aquimaris]